MRGGAYEMGVGCWVLSFSGDGCGCLCRSGGEVHVMVRGDMSVCGVQCVACDVGRGGV